MQQHILGCNVLTTPYRGLCFDSKPIQAGGIYRISKCERLAMYEKGIRYIADGSRGAFMRSDEIARCGYVPHSPSMFNT